GIESDRIGSVTILPKRLTQGHMPSKPGELVLGAALAEKLGTKLGDTVRLIVPFTKEATSAPKALNVQVVGICRFGMYDYDSKLAFMTLPAVQDFLGYQGSVTNFNIRLQPGSSAKAAADRLSGYFSYPL